ncbi:MAG: ECF-type sigma factor [Phycisphaerales bacterium]
MADDVAQLLARVASRDATAVDRLLPLVYAELRALAQDLLRGERRGHTLSATALVHEAYLKLVEQRSARLNDRAHFFAIAAQAMRRILVDHARGRNRIKRGRDRVRSLDTELVIGHEEAIDLASLDDALNRLHATSAEATRVVELRYFGGLTIQETAVVLEVSESTVERHWRYARAWLYRRLGEDADGGADGR